MVLIVLVVLAALVLVARVWRGTFASATGLVLVVGSALVRVGLVEVGLLLLVVSLFSLALFGFLMLVFD